MLFWARGGALRLAGWWVGLTGLFAATGGGCPCCGAPACANSLGAAGIVGALGALLLSALRRTPQAAQETGQTAGEPL